MLKVSIEQIILVVPMILVVTEAISARPRRRFCENYPFAPRCLGVSAKRSPSQYEEKDRQTLLDIYSTLIKGVLDEERRRKENFIQKEDSDIYEDDNNLLGELASTLDDNSHRQYKRETFIDSRDTWTEGFDDGRRPI